jgi:hypothetical protein
VVDEIRLTLPALPTYSRVARLAVTGLATRLGFSYDEIEDLRIAVGEVAGILLGDADEPRVVPPARTLVYRCSTAGDLLAIEAELDPPTDPVTPSELSEAILAAVVDEVTVASDRAGLRISKRRRT